MSSQKHIMLSYQWDHQKLVKEVYRRLKEINVPLWMDIEGGVTGHLSENSLSRSSIADGVENAAAMCCFLSPKYQDSVACKDELTYAKEQRICIIPILLIPNWKPTGWLGFSITGLKWINFRDVETNMDIRMQQLVSEIQVKAGDKLNCFHDVQMLTSIRDTKEGVENQNKVHSVPDYEEPVFDPNSYYRFTTEWLGDSKALDVVNDGLCNNQLMLADTGLYSGQWWKITPVHDGFYRLTTRWLGDGKSLDVVNDGLYNNQLILADTGPYSGQWWKITPVHDGFYRMTTRWLGDGKSLDVIEDGQNNKLILNKTDHYTRQFWKITKV